MLRAFLPLALLAVQAPTVALTPAEGSKTVHASSVKLQISSMEATVSSEITSTYSKVTDTEFTVEKVSKDLKILLDGNDMNTDASPVTAVCGKDGTVKSVSGGIPQANDQLLFLLFRFVPTAAETGKTNTVELKGNGSDLPDQKVESTYLGPKKVEAGEGYEYKQKTTAGELTAETDYVVKADGTILEATTKFSGLPIPAAGMSAEGTGTLKLKP